MYLSASSQAQSLSNKDKFISQRSGMNKTLLLCCCILLSISRLYAQTPVANFTTVPAPDNDTITICQGKTISFLNTSTLTIGTTTYSWNFGFGANPLTATGNLPQTVTYNTVGNNITAALSVDNNNGTSPSTKIIHINVISAPVSNITLFSSGGGFSTYTKNGNTAFIKCTTIIDSTTFQFNTNYSGTINQIFKWGDGTSSTQASISSNKISHKYPAGQYTLTHTVNFANGCSISRDYSIFNADKPVITISGSSTSLCLPSNYSFDIISNGVPIDYSVQFSDGSAPLVFTTSSDTTINHIFNTTSCGTDYLSFPNAYSVAVMAQNFCTANGTPTIGGIGPIVVSAKAGAFMITTPDTPICQGSPTFFINTSVSGQNITSSGCNSDYSFYWRMVQSNGFNFNSGDYGSNNGFIGSNLDYTQWKNGSSSLDITFTDTGVFNMWIYAANGCGIDSFQKKVHVIPSASVNVNIPSQTICSGDTAATFTFNSTLPGYKINWFIIDSSNVLKPDTVKGSGISTVVFKNKVFKTRDFGNGYITIAANTGCAGTTNATHTVNINQRADLIINNQDTIICNGTPTNINLTSTSGSTDISWISYTDTSHVKGNTSGNGANINDPLVTSNNDYDTVYYKVHLNNIGCPAKDSTIHVIVQPQLTFDNYANINLCPFQVDSPIAFVSHPPGAKFTWTNSDTIVGLRSSGTGNLPVFKTIDNNTGSNFISNVHVNASLNNCPNAGIDFLVVLHPIPTISFTKNPTTGLDCYADTGRLTAFVNSPTATYAWTGPKILSDTFLQGITVGKAGYYYVTAAENINTCAKVDSILVTDPDTFSILGFRLTGNDCYGDLSGTAKLFLSNDISATNFKWTPNVSIGDSANSLKGGHYQVIAINQSGCMDTADFNIYQPDSITIHVVDSSSAKSGTCGLGDGFIEVNATGGNGTYSYLWSNKHVSTRIENLGGGTFTVNVTDHKGCKAQASYVLICSPYVPPRVPQFISPNGDGKNDTWVIENIELYPDATLEVYNRWGNLVYKAAPYLNDWDGRNIGSGTNEYLPSGTYFFVIDTKVLNQPIKGFVEIQQ